LVITFISIRFHQPIGTHQKTTETNLSQTLDTSGHLEGRFQSCQDLVGLIKKIESQADPVSSYLYTNLSVVDQRALTNYLSKIDTEAFHPPPQSLRNCLINLLNNQMEQIEFFSPQRFSNLKISTLTTNLVSGDDHDPSSIRKRNQQLLLQAFPNEISPLDISDGPSNIEELKECLLQPRYIHTSSYERALHLLSTTLFQKNIFLSLVGKSGSGKTATAQALFQTLKSQGELIDQDLTVLSGTCSIKENSQTETNGSPFEPFQQALAEVFSIDLFASVKGQIEKIDQALDGLFESVVPFANLLFPSSISDESNVGSSSELFVSIERTLRYLSSRNSKKSSQPIILFIDDVQWIDSASRDLLCHLMKGLMAEPAPISIVLTAQSKESIEALSTEIQIIDLVEEDQSEQLRILTGAFNLHPLVAQRILGEIGDLKLTTGGLHLLINSIEELAAASAFKFENGTFVWDSDFQQHTENNVPLPISTQIQTAITELVNQVMDHRSILACAACIGLEFRVGILAEVLELSRLDVLQRLTEIEEKTNLIHDLGRSDDIFAFRSSVNLEVIRQRNGVRVKDPTQGNIAQIVREYHMRIAKVLIDKYPMEVFSIANHFYAAGLSYSEEAVQSYLNAARTALQQFAINDCLYYLKILEECQKIIGSNQQDLECLRLKSDLAHISGQERAIVADEGLAFLQDHGSQSVDTLLLIARSCYDAGIDEEEQKYFAQAIRLGQLVANNPVSSPIQKSEGLHFVGISLPVSKTAQRKNYLRQSLDLISNDSIENTKAQSLSARILNSLARQLENDNPEDAKSLYQQSLEVKQRSEIRDLNGLAITHNGLGRLALASRSPDLETATYHFKQSLSYAEEMGSPMDMSKSHSFLGLCANYQQNYQQALEEYDQSYRLAQSSIDKGFSGAGLLESYVRLGDKSNLSVFGKKIVAQILEDGGLPIACQDNMAAALKDCINLMDNDRIENDWIDQLQSIIFQS